MTTPVSCVSEQERTAPLDLKTACKNLKSLCYCKCPKLQFPCKKYKSFKVHVCFTSRERHEKCNPRSTIEKNKQH